MRTSTIVYMSILLLALCGPDRAPAQSGTKAPDQAPVTYPIDYKNGHIFVQVEDRHLGPLHLVLDTGAERTILSAAVAPKAQIAGSSSHKKYENIGGGSEKNMQQYRTIHLDLRSADTELFATEALVLRLNDLSGQLDHPVDGILGWDFFNRWCVRIDYSRRQLTLTEANQCSPPASPHGTLKGEWSKRGFLLPATITFSSAKTVGALLHLDTGGDSSLLLREKFRKAAGLTSNQTEKTGEPGFGMNGSYTTDMVVAKQVQIDGRVLNLTDANIWIGRHNSFSKTHWWQVGIAESRMSRDGELGNAILDHTTITLDPVRHCLYVEPASLSEPAEQLAK
jgi:hypothetical protein